MLIEDWCQQYPSHSIGALDFGPDGALYVTGGDGASFNFADWGQDGTPLNPCGDPPGGVGAMLSPPTAEGGALRSQDLRTPGDPTSLDGALLRVNPATGAGLPDNPNAASTDANARRIVAYGLRNPFRLGVRPGTGEVWIGDVGWGTWEEIQRIQQPTAAGGQLRLAVLRGPPLSPAERLRRGQPEHLREPLRRRARAAVQAPHYAWNHSAQVVPGETCPTGSSSAAGIAFGSTNGSNYPSEYHGALFFADYSRDCIWAMLPGAERRPRPGQNPHLRRRRRQPGAPPDRPRRRPLLSRLRRRHHPPSHLHLGKPAPERGDHGEPDHRSRSADRQLQRHRLQRPGRRLRSPTPGTSTATERTTTRQPRPPTYTYTIQGSYTASLRVTDNHGACDTATVTITVGNTPPTATIDAPAAGTTWKVGDVINFSGHATDAQDGTLPASALTWRLILQHCPSNCHTHPVQTFAGVAGGLIHRARPRVPLLPRARAHRDGLGRPDRHQDHPARPEDRDPDLQLHPGRPAA